MLEVQAPIHNGSHTMIVFLNLQTSEQILAKYQGASHSGSAGEPTNTDTDMDTDMTQTDTQVCI